MTPIESPIPFAQWGVDLVTDLPLATGNRRSLIVAVDYFRVEAEPMASTTQEQGIRFLWKNIICATRDARLRQWPAIRVEDFLASHGIK